MEYIIDFQAFRKPTNSFVIKDLAILNTNDGSLELYTFKPPFEWDMLPIKYKVENRWLENHYIHKEWTAGVVEYTELERILKKLSEAKKVYVKGDEKFVWLKNYMNNICNLEGNNALALEELRKIDVFKCNNHAYKNNYVSCAECNVKAIYVWCIFYLRVWK